MLQDQLAHHPAYGDVRCKTLLQSANCENSCVVSQSWTRLFKQLDVKLRERLELQGKLREREREAHSEHTRTDNKNRL